MWPPRGHNNHLNSLSSNGEQGLLQEPLGFFLRDKPVPHKRWEVLLFNPKYHYRRGGSTPEEPISRSKSSLLIFNVKGGDATTIPRTINEWVQKTAIALNTWPLQASTFWHQAVTAARAQHNWWLSLQPSDRASFIGLPTTNQTLPTRTPVVEATVRAELLNSVLPDKVTSMAMQKKEL